MDDGYGGSNRTRRHRNLVRDGALLPSPLWLSVARAACHAGTDGACNPGAIGPSLESFGVGYTFWQLLPSMLYSVMLYSVAQAKLRRLAEHLSP